jgi:hypothetical protein
MLIERPATTTVPVRAAPGFTPTLNLIVRLPSPDAGTALLIQDSSDRALHWHPPGVVSAIEISPPPGSSSWLVGDTSKRHGAASCMTAIRFWPTTTEPWRGWPLTFGATV